MNTFHTLVLLAPLVALFGLLLLGRYPGERVLRRRLPRRWSRWLRSTLTGARRRRAAHGCLPRGGALLAGGLAGRAPPHGSV